MIRAVTSENTMSARGVVFTGRYPITEGRDQPDILDGQGEQFLPGLGQNLRVLDPVIENRHDFGGLVLNDPVLPDFQGLACRLGRIGLPVGLRDSQCRADGEQADDDERQGDAPGKMSHGVPPFSSVNGCAARMIRCRFPSLAIQAARCMPHALV